MAVNADLTRSEPGGYREALAELDAALGRNERGEQIADEAAQLKADMGKFVVAAWPLLMPRDLTPTWHIRTFCEHLQAAYEREILRLVVTVPPGFLKSSILSVFGPAWAWVNNPGERVLSSSWSWPLAARDARRSRLLIQTDWFQHRWPLLMAKDENQTVRYSNAEGGARVCTHVGGGTGDRGTVCILDDPHNAMDTHSEAAMQAARDWWSESWASRLDDSAEQRGVKIVVGQRVAPDDMIGHILAGDSDDGDWTHLCLPVRYEAAHPFVYPAKVELPSGKVIHGDPRTKDGDLLAPAYMSEQILRDRTKDLTARVFNGQYQQRPAPAEGLMLKRANWRYYDPELSFYAQQEPFTPQRAEELESRVGAFELVGHFWDTSMKDRKKSDYVAGTTWGCVGANRYLLRVWHQRAGLNATIEAMLELANWALPLWPNCAHFTVIESTANGPDSAASIRDRVQGVALAAAKGSKEERAEAASPALDGFNCFLPGYRLADGSGYDTRTPDDVQEFVEELAGFPLNTNDDQVDSWSSMVLWTRSRMGVDVNVVAPTGEARPPRFHVERETRLRPSLRV